MEHDTSDMLVLERSDIVLTKGFESSIEFILSRKGT